MSGRIVLKGRTLVATPGMLRRRVSPTASLPRDGDGRRIDVTQSAAPGPAPSSLYGISLVDKDERVTYRNVRRLNPLEGWAPTEFWQARWKVDHEAVLDYVRAGLLDAAVEEGSQIRRYRVVDEARLLESELHKKHVKARRKRRA